LIASGKDRNTVGNSVNERWPSRQDLADRYGLPGKRLAQWASKGTGPPYARMGRHVRYRLSDVIDWETARIDDLSEAGEPAIPTHRHAIQQVENAASEARNAGNVGSV
jgi:hypothetical protein